VEVTAFAEGLVEDRESGSTHVVKKTKLCFVNRGEKNAHVLRQATHFLQQQTFRDGMRYTDPFTGRCTPTKFVNQDQRPWCRKPWQRSISPHEISNKLFT
jgi:hypothetical protein